ncbi:hypothetical protein [Bradyrhizobium guangzhouense]|uniref:Uncharacterized protein n=1 Tax=Bradyrhizobium guangzhouense TaxID=1325095 RepID=A0AAE6C6G2_9BRAD|nr:hypothetical protein [Bradyrhizobium guangzhouense]QAU44589.1 hypothetical protein XH91_03950 [Bradyrhizobium guangzhouense]RXH12613.1 hypothetical protein EAS56_16740 [Bradyrhizobium guangzhouense]
MLHRRAVLALLLAFAISPAFATAEHQYGKGEYAIILGGKAPNGKLSVAAHGGGESGSDGFRVYLMAEPAHRKLTTLDDINDDNILDTAPDAFHATWSADSRFLAVSFRSERHIVTLNIYAVDGARAKPLDGPDLFRDVTGRSAGGDNDLDMRTSVPDFTWAAPRRFHLTDYRVFVADDTALADKLGTLGKASKRDGGGNTIQFSAEADGEILPDGKIRMGKPRPGKFEDLP